MSEVKISLDELEKQLKNVRAASDEKIQKWTNDIRDYSSFERKYLEFFSSCPFPEIKEKYGKAKRAQELWDDVDFNENKILDLTEAKLLLIKIFKFCIKKVKKMYKDQY